MIEESRRRAYLQAMQVSTWLPRVALPFAAAPRQPLLKAFAEVEAPQLAVLPPAELSAPVDKPPLADAPVTPAVAPRELPPRFALQLLRAGECVLLVELPTGEPLASRDPAYLLLKDLLRAAGLPEVPHLLGEPVRWPLLAGGSLDQGPQAAREFLQGLVAAQLETGPPASCLWLLGMPAVRFVGEADEQALLRELQIEGLGLAWALPSLERLAEEASLKAELWRAMRRVRQRWLKD